METKTVVKNDARIRRNVLESGESLLKIFHSEYEKDPVGASTEYWRGKVSCWRQMLHIFYDESTAQEIVEEISARTKLSIPHGGPLTEDGTGYYGFDSGCHMVIGKLE